MRDEKHWAARVEYMFTNERRALSHRACPAKSSPLSGRGVSHGVRTTLGTGPLQRFVKRVIALNGHDALTTQPPEPMALATSTDVQLYSYRALRNERYSQGCPSVSTRDPR